MADEKAESDGATKEEDLALKELLAGEQAPGEEPSGEGSSAEQGPVDEEDKALEELLSGETPAAEGVKDEEAAALEELLAGSDSDAASPSEKKPATDDSNDGEAVALEERIAADEQGEDVPADKRASDGVITLNEVVALGGVSAAGDQAEEDEAFEALTGAKDESLSGLEAAQANDVEAAGLSREERDDLDRLIKGLKEEQPPAVSQAVITELEKQVKAMRNRIIQLSKLAKQHDKKIKSYSEIMRLFFKKSELMNERIDAITSTRKGGKKG
jgi:hypothetical protein